WKDESLEQNWWCTEPALDFSPTEPGRADPTGPLGPNQIVDDGGDATLLIHKGVEFEKAGKVPDAKADDSEEWVVILDLLRRTLAASRDKWTKMAKDVQGVSEETTTGVHRLYEMQQAGTLLFPAINVNDSVT